MNHRLRSAGRRRPAAVAALLGVLAGAHCVAPARAQIPSVPDLPWSAAADTAGGTWFETVLSRDWHEPTGWRALRLEMTVVARATAHTRFYLRAEFLSFDSADTPVLERWPDLRTEETPDDWPGERTVTGWGRPELGVLTPLRLPGLGPATLGLGLGLPVGEDRAYPFSAASMPLRVELRRVWQPWPQVALAVRGGREQTFDSSGADLAPEAFPSGWRYGAELAWRAAPRRGADLRWARRDLDGHTSERVEADLWVPLHHRSALGLRVAREVGPGVDRAADWHVALVWRLAGLTPETGDGAAAAGQASPPGGP